METVRQVTQRSRKAIRMVVFVNFFIALLFVVPITHRWVDGAFRALKKVGLEDPVGYSLQLWIVGSTLFATTLFIWNMIKKHARGASPGGLPESLAPDGVLLLGWWLTLVAICAYAFTLGMAG